MCQHCIASAITAMTAPRTLLVTGLQGRKCRLGMFMNTDSTCGTLHGPDAYFSYALMGAMHKLL